MDLTAPSHRPHRRASSLRRATARGPKGRGSFTRRRGVTAADSSSAHPARGHGRSHHVSMLASARPPARARPPPFVCPPRPSFLPCSCSLPLSAVGVSRARAAPPVDGLSKAVEAASSSKLAAAAAAAATALLLCHLSPYLYIRLTAAAPKGGKSLKRTSNYIQPSFMKSLSHSQNHQRSLVPVHKRYSTPWYCVYSIYVSIGT